MRKIPIRKHFAVFGGAGGFTGIVRSRAEAARLTSGVVNAKSKAFRTEAEATRYINYYLRKAGAGRLTFEDLQAAAAAPDEVREAEAVEETKAVEDDPLETPWIPTEFHLPAQRKRPLRTLQIDSGSCSLVLRLRESVLVRSDPMRLQPCLYPQSGARVPAFAPGADVALEVRGLREIVAGEVQGSAEEPHAV